MRTRSFTRTIALLSLSSIAGAQVVGEFRIAENQGGFEEDLGQGDQFGSDVAVLGDLDGDGFQDLAVGTPSDDDGASAAGAVWILFLNSSGNVKSSQKISATTGGFGGSLGLASYFGSSVANLGDLDGDGNVDLAVGAEGDRTIGFEQGSVWILFLNSNGTVKSEQKIDSANGGLGATLLDSDCFGSAVAGLGDLDGDGTRDLAVGAVGDDDGFTNAGAVYILFLNAAGTVKSEQKISATAGGLVADISAGDELGGGLAELGDFDGDTVPDLAIGMIRFDPSTSLQEQDSGAVLFCFLNADGTVKSNNLISQNQGGFTGDLEGDLFGEAISLIDDVDGDGVDDLIVGAPATKMSDAVLTGGIWVVFMTATGTVKEQLLLVQGAAGLNGPVKSGDYYGCGVGILEDYDGNGSPDLAIGALGTDMGGLDAGGLWIVSVVPALPIFAAFATRTDPNNDDTFIMVDNSSFTPFPSLGASARAQVDLGDPDGFDEAIFFAFDTPVTIPLSGNRTLLCLDTMGFGELLSGFGVVVSGNANNLARYNFSYANNGALVGFSFCMQALELDLDGVEPYKLTNAYDFTIGL